MRTGPLTFPAQSFFEGQVIIIRISMMMIVVVVAVIVVVGATVITVAVDGHVIVVIIVVSSRVGSVVPTLLVIGTSPMQQALGLFGLEIKTHENTLGSRGCGNRRGR
jgi:hypothetical protein